MSYIWYILQINMKLSVCASMCILPLLTCKCFLSTGEGPRAHLQRLAECIRWSYGAGIVLRLGNIARLELNYCIPMGVQSGDRYNTHTFGGAGQTPVGWGFYIAPLERKKKRKSRYTPRDAVV